LLQLERLGLVRRDHERGPRPLITVLRDDGSRDVFDDPGASSDSYVTFLGTIIAFGRLRSWKSPQLTAYIACMIAERYARSDAVFSKAVDLGQRPLGGGLWYRPLRWFADVDERRLEHHVRVPFSERTLKRGIQALKREGLLVTERIAEDPRSGRRFEKGPRVLFHNGFHDVRPGAKLRPSFPTRFRRSSSRAAT
jgi:hypothetical protein